MQLIIETVHAQDAPDPNFLLLSFRNETERKIKLGGVPGKFLQGRQVSQHAANQVPTRRLC